MDVMCFLCVTLISSTVQLHDSVGSGRACACSGAIFSSQNGDRDCEMYYLDRCSVVSLRLQVKLTQVGPIYKASP
jgi:hypothetical protein